MFYIAVLAISIFASLVIKVPFKVDERVIEFIYSIDIYENIIEGKEKVFNILLTETTHANFKGCPSAHDLTKQLLEGDK